MCFEYAELSKTPLVCFKQSELRTTPPLRLLYSSVSRDRSGRDRDSKKDRKDKDKDKDKDRFVVVMAVAVGGTVRTTFFLFMLLPARRNQAYIYFIDLLGNLLYFSRCLSVLYHSS